MGSCGAASKNPKLSRIYCHHISRSRISKPHNFSLLYRISSIKSILWSVYEIAQNKRNEKPNENHWKVKLKRLKYQPTSNPKNFTLINIQSELNKTVKKFTNKNHKLMQIARNNFFTTRSNAMKNWEDNELLQNHNYDYIVWWAQ